MVFIKNEAALLCVTMLERARASTCNYNVVYTFSIYCLPLRSSAFVVYFSTAFWHGNEAFPKGSTWNEIVPFLVIFLLPYSICRGVKICFYSCRYQNQNFSFVSFVTRFVRVALVSHLCCTRVARVWRSCLALVL